MSTRKTRKRQKRYHSSRAVGSKLIIWSENAVSAVREIACRKNPQNRMGIEKHKKIVEGAQQSLLLLEFFIFLIHILGDNERVLGHFSKLELFWENKRVNFDSLLFIGWSFSAHPMIRRKTKEKPSLFFLGKTTNGNCITFILSLSGIRNNYGLQIHKICDPTKIMYGDESSTSYGNFITPLTMTNERLRPGCQFGSFQGGNEDMIHFLSQNFVREPVLKILSKVMSRLPMEVLNIIYGYLFIH